jgi:hypothetical protein
VSASETIPNGERPGFFVSNFGVPLVLSSLNTTGPALLGEILPEALLPPDQIKTINLLRNAGNTSLGLRVTYWLCVAVTAGLLHLLTFICMQISLRSPNGRLLHMKQTLANSIAQKIPLEKLCGTLFEDFPKEGIKYHNSAGQIVTAKNPTAFLAELIDYTFEKGDVPVSMEDSTMEQLLSEDGRSGEAFIRMLILGTEDTNSAETHKNGITCEHIFNEFALGKRPEEILKLRDAQIGPTPCWR